MGGSTFRALPPGRESAAEAVQRFGKTVQDRLRLGDNVEMECRGQEAVNNAIRVLCHLQDHTAELEADWAEVEASCDGPASTLNVLQLRARRGATWAEFNATDFEQRQLLFASAKTDIKQLSWAVAKEVRKKGAVSVHAYSDNLKAVNIAVKALATVPKLTGGERVSCIPSHGWARPFGTGSVEAQGEKPRLHPVLRLQVTRPALQS